MLAHLPALAALSALACALSVNFWRKPVRGLRRSLDIGWAWVCL